MAGVITITTQPQVDPQTPTLTHYDDLAAEVMGAIETITAVLPKLEEAAAMDAKQVRRLLNIPDAFCGTAIGSVEQASELESSRALFAEKSRNRLQFLVAFRPVDAKVDAFSRLLKHTIRATKTLLADDSLAIYRVARAQAATGRTPALSAFVAAMKRDMNRPGLTKAQREERKAQQIQVLVDKALAGKEQELKKAA
jgi:hypothetical protein